MGIPRLLKMVNALKVALLQLYFDRGLASTHGNLLEVSN